MINSEEIRDIVRRDYDTIADLWSNDFGTTYTDKDISDIFLTYLKEHSKILDLGGGTGKLSHLFIENGHDSTIVDFSKEMMRKCKEYFGNIPYILDDIVNIGNIFEANSFDAIVAFYTLVYIPKENMNTLFSDVNKLLKKKGLYLFNVKIGDGEKMVDEPYLKEKGKNSLYHNYFSHEEIINLIQNNGFEVILKIEKKEKNRHQNNKKNENVFIIARKVKE